ncbi:MAG: hypothetical protein CMH52_02600 [Myxococcales bacterium]|nr:hypothetical protein [Myxococcales bacterium]|tara:strand:- start:2215 stop:3519 length:1305 start_codon:yes stop_codon:yes gene_type:complete
MNSRVHILVGVALALMLTIALHGNTVSQSAPIDFSLPKLSELNAIQISQTGRAIVDLIKQKGTWTLNPGHAQMARQAEHLLAELMNSNVTMDMDLGPIQTLNKYGLGTHSLRLKFTGERTFIIRVGKVVNDRFTFIYDEKSKHVYRARGDLRRVFDRAQIDWRDRQLFDLDYGSILRIESRVRPKPTWSAARTSSESRWAFTNPIDLDAGQDEMAAVVNTMVQAQAAAFVDSSIGFMEERTLKITTTSGQAYALSIGKPDATGQLPVRRITYLNGKGQTSPWVAMLPKHQAIFLNPTLEDLKNKKVFGFKVQDIERVTWTGDTNFQLTKANDTWVVAWNEKRKNLDRASADSFRENFANLRALKVESIRPEQPFLKGENTVSIRLHNGETERVYIGQKYGAGQRVKTQSKPNQVMILSRPSLDILKPQVNALFD